MDRLRLSLFEKGSEITRYYEMLPASPLKALYERMLATPDPDERTGLQDELRRRAVPGTIDVNIMTKLDRDRFSKGKMLPPTFSDAMSALRGYARSKLRSSLVLSAGMNRKLFAYLAEFPDFFPDDLGEIKKKIVLKVSDFRSGLVQGKLLARRGLWVSEYRFESGLNCGGHAFGGKGHLLGPLLEEFTQERDKLIAQFHEACGKVLTGLGHRVTETPLPVRVTVQGGIGTAEESEMLRRQYHVDGTGWGSPFLFVPEVVNLDEPHVRKLCEAGKDDIQLSEASPLGVPFWSLRTSASEDTRRRRIAEGRPGSPCPKGFLAANTEFTEMPICKASRAYQRRKLEEIDGAEMSEDERARSRDGVVVKACICNDLSGGATVSLGIDPKATPAVCCGPNSAYFSRVAQMKEMIDHIYGRARLPLDDRRPHMFINELSLHVDRLREEVARAKRNLLEALPQPVFECKENMLAGIRYYREKALQLAADRSDEFLDSLESMRTEIECILPGSE